MAQRSSVVRSTVLQVIESRLNEIFRLTVKLRSDPNRHTVVVSGQKIITDLVRDRRSSHLIDNFKTLWLPQTSFINRPDQLPLAEGEEDKSGQLSSIGAILTAFVQHKNKAQVRPVLRALTNPRYRQKTRLLVPPLMEIMSGFQSPPQNTVSIEVDLPATVNKHNEWMKTGNRFLVLDNVQDPANVGTLIRTASALGWSGVLASKDSCDPFHDKAIKAAAGATFWIPVSSRQMATGLIKAINSENLTPIIAVPSGGESLSSIKESINKKEITRLALILGNEGSGISNEYRKLPNRREVTIPMHEMDSLNVSVAGGILMHDLMDNPSGKQASQQQQQQTVVSPSSN